MGLDVLRANGAHSITRVYIKVLPSIIFSHPLHRVIAHALQINQHGTVVLRRVDGRVLVADSVTTF